MCTQKQLNSISEHMSKLYKSVYGSSVVSILLYGSYSRGDCDSDSDIDIVAIVKGEREDLQNKLKQIWDDSCDVGIENDVIISPTVIPFDEYEEYKDVLPYYMNIEREGRKIG